MKSARPKGDRAATEGQREKGREVDDIRREYGRDTVTCLTLWMITVAKGTSIPHHVTPLSSVIYGCVLIRRQRTVQIEILSTRRGARNNAGDIETMSVQFIARTAGDLTII